MKKEDSGLAGLGRLIEYGLVNKKYPLAYTCGTPGGFSTVGLSLGARHCVLASLRTPAEQVIVLPGITIKVSCRTRTVPSKGCAP